MKNPSEFRSDFVLCHPDLWVKSRAKDSLPFLLIRAVYRVIQAETETGLGLTLLLRDCPRYICPNLPAPDAPRLMTGHPERAARSLITFLVLAVTLCLSLILCPTTQMISSPAVRTGT